MIICSFFYSPLMWQITVIDFQILNNLAYLEQIPFDQNVWYFFTHCCSWLDNVSLGIFAPIFMKYIICRVFCFWYLYLSLVWVCWHHRWVRKCSLWFYYLEKIIVNWFNFYLKYLVGFTSETVSMILFVWESY